MDWSWLINNKEWLFSGVGVALFTTVLAVFMKRKSGRLIAIKKATAGNSSKIIQADGDVSVSIDVVSKEK